MPDAGAPGVSFSAIAALLEGRHADPFALLGPHDTPGGLAIRAYVPHAETLHVLDAATGETLSGLNRRDGRGFFEGVLPGKPAFFAYRLRAANAGGVWELDDPYRFGPFLGEVDDYLMGEGTHRRLWEKLGAHAVTHSGVAGVHFAVWAPNASRVSVVGDFNAWDGRVHPMRLRLSTGVWEIFIPGLGDGAPYKFEIKARDGRLLPLKADPLGAGGEMRPENASVVRDIETFVWNDEAWMARRAQANNIGAPVSIYEVHLGSWRRGEDDRFLTYDELGDSLIPYAADMGFTHLELLPISEHPLDASWGYQPIGMFAPTARHGTPADFARFVDRCHQAGLGVLIDWVPAHFPSDAHGLARFDGTCLYEHEDPRLGFHQDWNTLIYNYGRTEVVNFLIASALFWLERYHIDGLRCDAVASMLYLDYSRKEGEWLPNRFGGRENLEAVSFLKRMNEAVYAEHPGIMMVAEESTAWPGVSRPTSAGGLGFGYKWNMGWMHDTLNYMQEDPINRRYHHHKMTFGLLYGFSENFILPLSHDEVVHGKGSILGRMPGDEWRRFANLRAYYGFMWAHPGKKLLFMGQEFAQSEEWTHARSLDWHLTQYAPHSGVQKLVRDLNRLYRGMPALHALDCEPGGFEWIEADDAVHSIFAWIRRAPQGGKPCAVVCNFTPVPHDAYRLALPGGGRWIERLNTDATIYGGAGLGNLGSIEAKAEPHHGRPFSAVIALPPLSTVIFEQGDG